jgi:hypothetical protein
MDLESYYQLSVGIERVRLVFLILHIHIYQKGKMALEIIAEIEKDLY